MSWVNLAISTPPSEKFLTFSSVAETFPALISCIRAIFSFEEISALEREALGFNLKYDMFIKYLPFKQKNKTVDLANLKEGVSAKVFFITKNVKVIKDKNNKDMAFFVACDSGCNYDAVIFSRNYEELKGGLEEGRAYIAIAKLQTQVRNGETKTSLICDNIYVIK